MLSPNDLRAEAARCRAEAEACAKGAEQRERAATKLSGPRRAMLLKDAADLRAFASGLVGEAAVLDELARGLRSVPVSGKTGAMEVGTRSRGASVTAGRVKHGFAFQEALKARGLSLPEWVATQRGLALEAAKSWVKRPGKGGRSIPRVWANRIAAEFMGDDGVSLVPADESSWPSGIQG